MKQPWQTTNDAELYVKARTRGIEWCIKEIKYWKSRALKKQNTKKPPK